MEQQIDWAAWRPRRRAWLVEGVSARHLRQPADSGGLRFSLWLPQHPRSKELQQQWELVYVSEPCFDAQLPDWAPLPWQEIDPLGELGGTGSVLVAVHSAAAGPDEAAAAALRALPAGGRPRLALQAEAQGEPESEAHAAAEAVPGDAAAAGGAAVAAPQPNGSPHVAADGAEYAPSKYSGSAPASPQQAALPESEPAAAPAPGGASDAAAAAEPAATRPPAAPAEPLREQLQRQLPAAECPGALVAAWRVGLEQLTLLGTDQAAVAAAEPGLQPDSLLLELPDGVYVAPPPRPRPLVASAPASSAPASPHRVSGAGPAPEPEWPAAGAPRRLANLLMSKLLPRAGPSPAAADLLPGALDDQWAGGGADTPTPSKTAPSVFAAAATVSPRPPQPASKALSLADVRRSVAALVGLRASLRAAQARHDDLRRRLSAALAVRQAADARAAELAGERDAERALRRRADGVRAALAAAQRDGEAAKRTATVRAQALITALKMLQAAERRLAAAEAALRGPEGRGQLAAVHRELVGRRCLMVSQLARLHRVGPITVHVPEAPPGGYLEDQLEAHWAGAAAPAQQPGMPAAAAPAPLLGSPAAAALGSSPLYRQEVRLAVGGLELDPSVWRKAVADVRYDYDPGEDRAAGVALGYVAHMVDRLAAYLDVPLRYPLRPCGSRSTIADGYLPLRAWTAQAPVCRSTLFGGRAEPGAPPGGTVLLAPPADAGPPPSSYPLYCDSNRERARFAFGVFLLNKDLSQLLAVHGISAGGPAHLLRNLYSLVLAAQSAL